MCEHDSDDEIILSPEHGLNPMLVTCFWCGKETGEIALLGLIDDDDPEAPHLGPINYDPCDECKSQWDQGIVIFAVESNGKPTGQWLVIDEEALPKVFTENAASRLLDDRMGCVSPELFSKMIKAI